jgi:hypothetical protein
MTHVLGTSVTSFLPITMLRTQALDLGILGTTFMSTGLAYIAGTNLSEPLSFETEIALFPVIPVIVTEALAPC